MSDDDPRQDPDTYDANWAQALQHEQRQWVHLTMELQRQYFETMNAWPSIEWMLSQLKGK